MNKGVAANPLKYTVVFLISDLIELGKPCLFVRPVLIPTEKTTGKLMHQGRAFVFFFVSHPITAPVALMRVFHERVRAAATLIKTVMGEAVVTVTDSSGTQLDARSMAIAVFFATVFDTNLGLDTEAVLVSVVAFRTLRAVKASELGMAYADPLTARLFNTLSCANSVTIARRCAYL